MNTAMTATSPQQAAELFREEIRASLEAITIEINGVIAEVHAVRADLFQMREGLTHASQPAPTATNAPTMVIPMTRLIKTRTNGKNYYKMQGGQYMKRGITVWDEVLKVLDLDPAAIEWDAQDAHTFKTPLNVTVLMQEYTDSESGEIKTGPQKVIGHA
jgi:hypothetical protein